MAGNSHFHAAACKNILPRRADGRVSPGTQLYALPGVELLPASITEDEMPGQYRNCHAVALPDLATLTAMPSLSRIWVQLGHALKERGCDGLFLHPCG